MLYNYEILDWDSNFFEFEVAVIIPSESSHPDHSRLFHRTRDCLKIDGKFQSTFYRKGCTKTEAATQQNNLSACKAFEHASFFDQRKKYFYHIWL